MQGIQTNSMLWSEESDSSLASLRGKETECQSLLLSIISPFSYVERPYQTNYLFPFYEIIPDNYQDFAKMRFPKEIESGCFEYKVKLNDIKSDRLMTLGTQMKWRLQEGNGNAYYELGISDEGEPVGLKFSYIRESINALIKICRMIDADIASARCLSINHSSRKETPTYICEVKIRFCTNENETTNRRIYMLGSHSVGKTTLIGVLTKGLPDDGNGSARVGLFNHLHEIKSGHTSSISYHLLGFTSDGKVLNNTNCEDKADIFKNSRSSITFIDSCGSRKFLDTTLNGLTCHYPHAIFLLLNPQRMTNDLDVDFIKIALSWSCQTVIIFTHRDTSDNAMIDELYRKITSLADSSSDKNVVLLKTLREFNLIDNHIDANIVPVIPISCVTGHNIDLLMRVLKIISLQNTTTYRCSPSCTEFLINTFYDIPGTGFVVSGILLSGSLQENDEIFFGPIFKRLHSVKITSIKRFGYRCQILCSGELATVAVNSQQSFNPKLKKGTYLLSIDSPLLTSSFSASVKCKYSTAKNLHGCPGFIHIGNCHSSAIMNPAKHDETELIQDIRVSVHLTNKSFYIPKGLKLIFKCESHMLVGTT